MAIADTGKAEAQPLSPDAYQAQQAEIARLSQSVQLAEVENQGLRAKMEDNLAMHQAEEENLYAMVTGLRARVAELEELLEMQRGATDAVIADKKRILEMSDAAIGVLQARGAELSAECERLSYLEAWVAKREEYEAQSERLQNTCGLVVAENKRLSARVDEVLSFIARHPQFAHEFPSSVTVSIETPLETPQNPPSLPQGPPVPVLAGDSTSEYAGMPWEGRP